MCPVFKVKVLFASLFNIFDVLLLYVAFKERDTIIGSGNPMMCPGAVAELINVDKQGFFILSKVVDPLSNRL